MTDPGEFLVAVRFVAIGAAVLLLPGLMFLSAVQVRCEWHERVVLALALSYSWVFALSALLPLFGLAVDAAAMLTAPVLAGLAWLIVERSRRHPLDARASSPAPRAGTMMVVVAIGAWAVVSWIIEPPFTGEEALDLVSISRFADGGPIAFDNTSLFPATRPVYLFQPYQLAIGAMARWSGMEPIVALVKFRALLAPLALVLVYSLLRALTTRMEATAAFVAVLLFVMLDMNTWEWNSLFPFVRRGGVGAGFCMPLMLTLCILATRRAHQPDARLTRRVALAAAPVTLLASLATHPLEMFPVLWFTAGLASAIVFGLDPAGARKPALVLVLLLSATAAAYVAVQARAVPYVAAYERDDKAALRAQLREFTRDPIRAMRGGPSEARDLWSRTIPDTAAVVAGIPAIALAVWRTPSTAVVLALGIVPLGLLYAVPAGLIALTLITSVETVRDVNAYFGLLGLVTLALGLTSLAQASLHGAAWRSAGLARVLFMSAAGSLVIWFAWRSGRSGMRWFAEEVTRTPELLLLIAVAAAAVAISVAAWRTTCLNPARFPQGVILMTAALALPFAAPGWGFGGIFSKRAAVTLVDRLREAAQSPSVRDWPAYYDTLKVTYARSLSAVPFEVVDALRMRIPPRQVVLAHPSYSCDLAMLINAYCINPEGIPGHYYQPAAPYLARYVVRPDGQAAQHPLFNSSLALSDLERGLLREHRISYVLAEPVYGAYTEAKLASDEVGASLELELRGFRLYRMTQP